MLTDIKNPILLPNKVLNNETEAKLVPNKIPVLPANPIVGRNGKSYVFNADKVIEGFKKDKKDIPVDFNHESELNAKEGYPAPAAGWLKSLSKEKDGSVWGEVKWNDVGEAAVKNMQYRYISPALIHNSGEVERLTSVALTNKPNFYLQSLNSEDLGEVMKKEEPVNTIDKDILTSLGLPETSNKEAAIEAITALKKQTEEKSLNSEGNLNNKELIKEVNRLNNLVVSMQKTAFEEKKSKALNSLMEKGKIAPITYDFYIKSLNNEELLDDFVSTMGKTSGVLAGEVKPKEDLTKSLNSEEVEFAKKHGLDEKQFLETKAKIFNK